jgi:uncharacterized membrane protein YphA (DoxX/SURF4 family)
MLLFWGMFLPLGSRWSLDARFCKTPAESRVTSIATVAVLLQVFWMYWSSGLVKWNEVWLSGGALEAVFSDTMIARPLGTYLLQYPSLLHVLTLLVLGLELVGPLLLFCPWRNRSTRPIALIAFVAMHLGIELAMHVLIFSYVSLAALTLFVPGDWWQVGPAHKVAAWLDARFSSEAAPERQRRESRKSVEKSRTRERLLRAVVIFFLIYIPAYNITGRSAAARNSPTWQSIHRLGDLMGFMQEWHMFATPWGDRPVVAVAKLDDGSLREILRDEPAEVPPRRPSRPIRFASQRWMLLTRWAVTERYRRYREGAVLYFCRRWDIGAKSGRKIETLDLYHFPPPGEDLAASQPLARVVRTERGEFQYSEPEHH